MLIRRVLSSLHLVDLIAPLQKKFTVHRTLFLHAAWLDQASAHCPIFLTAASRRSLDRVSVPGPCLSSSVGDLPLRTPRHRRHGGPLPRHPANVTRAHPPPGRPFPSQAMPPARIWGVSRRFRRLSPCGGQVAHALRTLAPVAAKVYCYPSRCPSTCMC